MCNSTARFKSLSFCLAFYGLLQPFLASSFMNHMAPYDQGVSRWSTRQVQACMMTWQHMHWQDPGKEYAVLHGLQLQMLRSSMLCTCCATL